MSWKQLLALVAVVGLAASWIPASPAAAMTQFDPYETNDWNVKAGCTHLRPGSAFTKRPPRPSHQVQFVGGRPISSLVEFLLDILPITTQEISR